MKWWWRGQRPFQRGGARPPRIAGGMPRLDEGFGQANKENEHADTRNIRAPGRHVVPAGKRIRIVDIAARHSGKPEEVLRKEDDVDANEREPEMQFSNCL